MVRLVDENGRRGGVDKRCRIQVHLLDAPVAVVDQIGLALYTVIDSAAERIGRVVVKHLDRSRIDRRRISALAQLVARDGVARRPHFADAEGDRA